jgi:hypothetical protein
MRSRCCTSVARACNTCANDVLRRRDHIGSLVWVIVHSLGCRQFSSIASEPRHTTIVPCGFLPIGCSFLTTAEAEASQRSSRATHACDRASRGTLRLDVEPDNPACAARSPGRARHSRGEHGPVHIGRVPNRIEPLAERSSTPAWHRPPRVKQPAHASPNYRLADLGLQGILGEAHICRGINCPGSAARPGTASGRGGSITG